MLRVPTHCSNPSRVSRVALNRHNIILRDQGRCQYCGSAKNLTIDHVVPQVGGVPPWLPPPGARPAEPDWPSASAVSAAQLQVYGRYRCLACGGVTAASLFDWRMCKHFPALPLQSKGGRNTWENLVACCSTCNSRKGDKSLEQLGWKLHCKPTEPSPHRMEVGVAAGLWIAGRGRVQRLERVECQ